MKERWHHKLPSRIFYSLGFDVTGKTLSSIQRYGEEESTLTCSWIHDTSQMMHSDIEILLVQEITVSVKSQLFKSCFRGRGVWKWSGSSPRAQHLKPILFFFLLSLFANFFFSSWALHFGFASETFYNVVLWRNEASTFTCWGVTTRSQTKFKKISRASDT